ncbi:unnamed protein product [Spirodela intermedia]|uniref:AB hydrolase-1 domain-containing protein n=1 Tax=Spirodela intermedia TaxID=51605 RepID=A0A7I8I7R5_SPIIN|nr:unnamed protein product [Spirodela intermedia]CAA6653589.1 unnamed protein product [Spirodela intermedia]
MGALLSCISEKEVRRRAPPGRRRPPPSAGDHRSLSAVLGSSSRWSKLGASRKDRSEEALIQEQALAAALLLQQNGVGLPLDRSASLRFQAPGKKKEGLPRSSSSRARSLADPLLQPHQLVSQDLKIDDLETGTIVLVHGGGFGAWCWYKTIVFLEESGFKVIALDLAGCGVHSFDTNRITSLSQYVKPLTDFLEKLADGEKVILVGHDLGGACISFAMEIFPSKVAKAVYIAAAMLKSGQSTLDMFSLQEGVDDLMRQAQVFIYGNGSDRPPTAIDLKKSSLKDLMFNQSPSKVSPLSDRVFRLKGSDHSPFFSKPQALHKLLVEISRIPKNSTPLPPPAAAADPGLTSQPLRSFSKSSHMSVCMYGEIVRWSQLQGVDFASACLDQPPRIGGIWVLYW